ncbi:hypothetical protein C2845_PM17G13480 [Panicum miliaceum]|uniref:Uncharacterized protein n=1 Tax=Panicum miliaceum TaxID=4540 RepID=A0A3L6Q0D3_PANMI|nr:hypothetical protein C2845_PM17G13480 [Panicum miliaceum]
MIRRMLRDAPTYDEPCSSITKCYSVIGIHGIPGSGKTTLGQYVSVHEKKQDYFNLFMWIHVSKNFSVGTLFAEMLETASNGKGKQFSNLDMLQEELEKYLRGKRFFLVLDDVWYDKNVSRQELDLLLSPLEAGEMGSRVLVTTRTADAARALGAQNLVAISDMDKEHFLSMFMHYALEGARITDEALIRKYWSIGEKIAGKLGRSPLAARTVAGQLKLRLDFDFWIRTMNSDLLNNETMAALWWSYQQLEEHVKRCFTYCSIFPRRYELQRDELVHLWMAEGFVKTDSEEEDMEDVGRDSFHVLLSTSFIQPKAGRECFTIHDLLHELAGRAAGSDCYRIEEYMVSNIPRDVRHIFVASYDRTVFRKEILNFKSLRTLIMPPSRYHWMHDEDFRCLFENLKKLRVVQVRLGQTTVISKGIGEQKHLRYIRIVEGTYDIILPRRFTKLYHLQKFAVTGALHYFIPKEIANLVNLRYMALKAFNCPDIGRLTLLRTLPVFTVRKAQGYEIHQLEHLDNLRGTLTIEGLENVRSKEEARRAKLPTSLRSGTEIELQFDAGES